MERCSSAVIAGLSLEWIVKPFRWPGDTLQDSRQKAFLAKTLIICLGLNLAHFFHSHFVDHDYNSDFASYYLCVDMLSLYLFLTLTSSLAYLYFRGITTSFKIALIVASFIWLMIASMLGPLVPWYMFLMLLLDGTHILQTDKDALMLHRLSMFMLALFGIYMGAHVYGEGIGSSIHFYKEEQLRTGYPETYIWTTVVVPLAMNHILVKSYAESARHEADNLNKSVELAHMIAEKLADYDLDAAGGLLEVAALASESVRLCKPLSQVLRNLRSYRAFLPNALFARDCGGGDIAPPNKTLLNAMHGEATSWETAGIIVSSLRDPGYSLKKFGTDLNVAFPELRLYTEGSSKYSSGLSGSEGFQRTMGALYSLYCGLRLDMDGKEVFAFGVDKEGQPYTEPQGKDASRKRSFYDNMRWDSICDLFIRADLMYKDHFGLLHLNDDRVLAFIVLTVVHDIMKNTELCPAVQSQHAPYRGTDVNEVIMDHDVGLASVDGIN